MSEARDLKNAFDPRGLVSPVVKGDIVGLEVRNQNDKPINFLHGAVVIDVRLGDDKSLIRISKSNVGGVDVEQFLFDTQKIKPKVEDTVLIDGKSVSYKHLASTTRHKNVSRALDRVIITSENLV